LRLGGAGKFVYIKLSLNQLKLVAGKSQLLCQWYENLFTDWQMDR